jgi:hypothetical protein
MIAALIALQLVQVQPAVRPAPSVGKARASAPANLLTRKRHVTTEAEGLIARAEGYRGTLRAAGKPADPDMDALVNAMKDDLDSMSEMGEMESLRLQMAMDRLSKMMATLSNLLKKASDTSQTITQNIK